jgi:hypothetical protein
MRPAIPWLAGVARRAMGLHRLRQGGRCLSPRELAALAKLTANWRSVIEDAALMAQERADTKSGRQGLL